MVEFVTTLLTSDANARVSEFLYFTSESFLSVTATRYSKVSPDVTEKQQLLYEQFDKAIL